MHVLSLAHSVTHGSRSLLVLLLLGPYDDISGAVGFEYCRHQAIRSSDRPQFVERIAHVPGADEAAASGSTGPLRK